LKNEYAFMALDELDIRWSEAESILSEHDDFHH